MTENQFFWTKNVLLWDYATWGCSPLNYSQLTFNSDILVHLTESAQYYLMSALVFKYLLT